MVRDLSAETLRQTIGADYFQGLGELEAALATGRSAPRVEKLVVYGGDRSEKRAQGRALSWRAIDGFDWVRA